MRDFVTLRDAMGDVSGISFSDAALRIYAIHYDFMRSRQNFTSPAKPILSDKTMPQLRMI